jgi:F-type H+-transporting ATPase subunit delta
VQAIARRYAVALADVVTKRGEAREVQDELSGWVQMMQTSTPLLEVFRNPTIPYEQKRKVVDTLIERTRVRPTTANFLRVLLQNHRLADLREVSEAFAQELDRRSGVVSAHVTTARQIAEQEREALRARLSELTKRNVRLEFAVDENLIGGVVTRIGSTIYDGSVRGQLEQVRRRMAGEQ